MEVTATLSGQHIWTTALLPLWGKWNWSSWSFKVARGSLDIYARTCPGKELTYRILQQQILRWGTWSNALCCGLCMYVAFIQLVADKPLVVLWKVTHCLLFIIIIIIIIIIFFFLLIELPSSGQVYLVSLYIGTTELNCKQMLKWQCQGSYMYCQ